MKRAKLFSVMGVCLLVLMICGFVPTASAKTVQLVFATGNIGGTWYPIGSAISSYITKNVEGLTIAAQSTGGATENLNLLDSNQVDLALNAGSHAYKSYRGIEPYKKKYTNMMGIGMLHRNTLCVYALKETGMKEIIDVKGRKINAGPPGTGQNKILADILTAHGMSFADIKAVNLPFKDAVSALKDKRIEGSVMTAGIPAAPVLDVASVRDIVILNYAPGTRDKMIEMNPYYFKTTIPAGTYPKIDRDVPAMAEGTLFLCTAGLPEDVVYEITKAVYSKEGLAYLGQVHPAAKGITFENGLEGMTVKLHPGAARFWKEAGLYKAWEESKIYE